MMPRDPLRRSPSGGRRSRRKERRRSGEAAVVEKLSREKEPEKARDKGVEDKYAKGKGINTKLHRPKHHRQLSPTLSSPRTPAAGQASRDDYFYAAPVAAPLARNQEVPRRRRTRRVASGSSSSASSSSSDVSRSSSTAESLLNISAPRTQNTGGLFSFFRSPKPAETDRPQHIHRTHKKKRRFLRFGNTSSSSFDDGLVYGKGYMSRSSADDAADDDDYEDYEDVEDDKQHAEAYGGPSIDSSRRSSKKPTPPTDNEEILRIGRELAQLAKEENRNDLARHGRRPSSKLAAAAVAGVGTIETIRRVSTRRRPQSTLDLSDQEADELAAKIECRKVHKNRNSAASRSSRLFMQQPVPGASYPSSTDEDDGEWESASDNDGDDDDSMSDSIFGGAEVPRPGTATGTATGTDVDLIYPLSDDSSSSDADSGLIYGSSVDLPGIAPSTVATTITTTVVASTAVPAIASAASVYSSRKSSVDDPRLFGPVNSLRGSVTIPYGYDDYQPGKKQQIVPLPELPQQPQPSPPSQSDSRTQTREQLRRRDYERTEWVAKLESHKKNTSTSTAYGRVPAGESTTIRTRVEQVEIQSPKPVTPVNKRVFSDDIIEEEREREREREREQEREKEREKERERESDRYRRRREHDEKPSLPSAAFAGVVGAVTVAATMASRNRTRRTFEDWEADHRRETEHGPEPSFLRKDTTEIRKESKNETVCREDVVVHRESEVVRKEDVVRREDTIRKEVEVRKESGTATKAIQPTSRPAEAAIVSLIRNSKADGPPKESAVVSHVRKTEIDTTRIREDSSATVDVKSVPKPPVDPSQHRGNDSAIYGAPVPSPTANIITVDGPSWANDDDSTYAPSELPSRAPSPKDILERVQQWTAPVDRDAIVVAESVLYNEDLKGRHEGPRGRSPGRDESRDSCNRTEREIREEADRYYRKTNLARRIAEDQIRSRSTSPDGESILDRYSDDKDDRGKSPERSPAERPTTPKKPPVIIRIVTPPEMERRTKKSPYDGPDADVRIDNRIYPRDLSRFLLRSSTDPSADASNAQELSTRGRRSMTMPIFKSRDPSCERERPMLNIVMPTPLPSPNLEKQLAKAIAPESPVQDAKYTKKETTESKDVSQVVAKPDISKTIISPRGEVIQASPAVVEIPAEAPTKHKLRKKDRSGKKSHWPAIFGAVAATGAAAASTAAHAVTSITSSEKKEPRPESKPEPKREAQDVPEVHEVKAELLSKSAEPKTLRRIGRRIENPVIIKSSETIRDEHYNIGGFPGSSDESSRPPQPPSPATKPARPKIITMDPQPSSPREKDLELAAIMGVGLQSAGFQDDMVVHDSSLWQRKESAPMEVRHHSSDDSIVSETALGDGPTVTMQSKRGNRRRQRLEENRRQKEESEMLVMEENKTAAEWESSVSSGQESKAMPRQVRPAAVLDWRSTYIPVAAKSEDSEVSPSNGSTSGNNVNGREPQPDLGRDQERRDRKGKASEEPSFLADAGTLGAGVGFAGAMDSVAAAAASAVARVIATDAPSSKETGETVRDQRKSRDRPRTPSDAMIDPEIIARVIRPAIDPSHGDLLPLPPSRPGSAPPDFGVSGELLPRLPPSRPETPPDRSSNRERDNFIRETMEAVAAASSRRRSMSLVKPSAVTGSPTAVPIHLLLQRSGSPSTSVAAGAGASNQPSPMQSPVVGPSAGANISPDISPMSYKRTSRPQSWDSTRDLKPLRLVQHARTPSQLADGDSSPGGSGTVTPASTPVRRAFGSFSGLAGGSGSSSTELSPLREALARASMGGSASHRYSLPNPTALAQQLDAYAAAQAAAEAAESAKARHTEEVETSRTFRIVETSQNAETIIDRRATKAASEPQTTRTSVEIQRSDILRLLEQEKMRTGRSSPADQQKADRDMTTVAPNAAAPSAGPSSGLTFSIASAFASTLGRFGRGARDDREEGAEENKSGRVAADDKSAEASVVSESRASGEIYEEPPMLAPAAVIRERDPANEPGLAFVSPDDVSAEAVMTSKKLQKKNRGHLKHETAAVEVAQQDLPSLITGETLVEEPAMLPDADTKFVMVSEETSQGISQNIYQEPTQNIPVEAPQEKLQELQKAIELSSADVEPAVFRQVVEEQHTLETLTKDEEKKEKDIERGMPSQVEPEEPTQAAYATPTVDEGSVSRESADTYQDQHPDDRSIGEASVPVVEPPEQKVGTPVAVPGDAITPGLVERSSIPALPATVAAGLGDGSNGGVDGVAPVAAKSQQLPITEGSKSDDASNAERPSIGAAVEIPAANFEPNDRALTPAANPAYEPANAETERPQETESHTAIVTDSLRKDVIVVDEDLADRTKHAVDAAPVESTKVSDVDTPQEHDQIAVDIVAPVVDLEGTLDVTEEKATAIPTKETEVATEPAVTEAPSADVISAQSPSEAPADKEIPTSTPGDIATDTIVDDHVKVEDVVEETVPVAPVKGKKAKKQQKQQRRLAAAAAIEAAAVAAAKAAAKEKAAFTETATVTKAIDATEPTAETRLEAAIADEAEPTSAEETPVANIPATAEGETDKGETAFEENSIEKSVEPEVPELPVAGPESEAFFEASETLGLPAESTNEKAIEAAPVEAVVEAVVETAVEAEPTAQPVEPVEPTPELVTSEPTTISKKGKKNKTKAASSSEVATKDGPTTTADAAGLIEVEPAAMKPLEPEIAIETIMTETVGHAEEIVETERAGPAEAIKAIEVAEPANVEEVESTKEATEESTWVETAVPTAPAEAEPAEPVEPSKAVESAPVGPSEQVEAAKPAEETVSVEAAKVAEPAELTEITQPSQPQVEVTEPIQLTPAEPETTETVESVKPAEATEVAEPAEPVEPVEPAQIVETVQPTQPVEPAADSELSPNKGKKGKKKKKGKSRQISVSEETSTKNNTVSDSIPSEVALNTEPTELSEPTTAGASETPAPIEATEVVEPAAFVEPIAPAEPAKLETDGSAIPAPSEVTISREEAAPVEEVAPVQEAVPVQEAAPVQKAAPVQETAPAEPAEPASEPTPKIAAVPAAPESAPEPVTEPSAELLTVKQATVEPSGPEPVATETATTEPAITVSPTVESAAVEPAIPESAVAKPSTETETTAIAEEAAPIPQPAGDAVKAEPPELAGSTPTESMMGANPSQESLAVIASTNVALSDITLAVPEAERSLREPSPARSQSTEKETEVSVPADNPRLSSDTAASVPVASEENRKPLAPATVAHGVWGFLRGRKNKKDKKKDKKDKDAESFEPSGEIPSESGARTPSEHSIEAPSEHVRALTPEIPIESPFKTPLASVMEEPEQPDTEDKSSEVVTTEVAVPETGEASEAVRNETPAATELATATQEPPAATESSAPQELAEKEIGTGEKVTYSVHVQKAEGGKSRRSLSGSGESLTSFEESASVFADDETSKKRKKPRKSVSFRTDVEEEPAKEVVEPDTVVESFAEPFEPHQPIDSQPANEPTAPFAEPAAPAAATEPVQEEAEAVQTSVDNAHKELDKEEIAQEFVMESATETVEGSPHESVKDHTDDVVEEPAQEPVEREEVDNEGPDKGPDVPEATGGELAAEKIAGQSVGQPAGEPIGVPVRNLIGEPIGVPVRELLGEDSRKPSRGPSTGHARQSAAEIAGEPATGLAREAVEETDKETVGEGGTGTETDRQPVRHFGDDEWATKECDKGGKEKHFKVLEDVEDVKDIEIVQSRTIIEQHGETTETTIGLSEEVVQVVVEPEVSSAANVQDNNVVQQETSAADDFTTPTSSPKKGKKKKKKKRKSLTAVNMSLPEQIAQEISVAEDVFAPADTFLTKTTETDKPAEVQEELQPQERSSKNESEPDLPTAPETTEPETAEELSREVSEELPIVDVAAGTAAATLVVPFEDTETKDSELEDHAETVDKTLPTEASPQEEAVPGPMDAPEEIVLSQEEPENAYEPGIVNETPTEGPSPAPESPTRKLSKERWALEKVQQAELEAVASQPETVLDRATLTEEPLEALAIAEEIQAHETQGEVEVDEAPKENVVEMDSKTETETMTESVASLPAAPSEQPIRKLSKKERRALKKRALEEMSTKVVQPVESSQPEVQPKPETTQTEVEAVLPETGPETVQLEPSEPEAAPAETMQPEVQPEVVEQTVPEPEIAADSTQPESTEPEAPESTESTESTELLPEATLPTESRDIAADNQMPSEAVPAEVVTAEEKATEETLPTGFASEAVDTTPEAISEVVSTPAPLPTASEAEGISTEAKIDAEKLTVSGEPTSEEPVAEQPTPDEPAIKQSAEEVLADMPTAEVPVSEELVVPEESPALEATDETKTLTPQETDAVVEEISPAAETEDKSIVPKEPKTEPVEVSPAIPRELEGAPEQILPAGDGAIVVSPVDDPKTEFPSDESPAFEGATLEEISAEEASKIESQPETAQVQDEIPVVSTPAVEETSLEDTRPALTRKLSKKERRAAKRKPPNVFDEDAEPPVKSENTAEKEIQGDLSAPAVPDESVPAQVTEPVAGVVEEPRKEAASDSDVLVRRLSNKERRAKKRAQMPPSDLDNIIPAKSAKLPATLGKPARQSIEALLTPELLPKEALSDEISMIGSDLQMRTEEDFAPATMRKLKTTKQRGTLQSGLNATDEAQALLPDSEPCETPASALLPLQGEDVLPAPTYPRPRKTVPITSGTVASSVQETQEERGSAPVRFSPMDLVRPSSPGSLGTAVEPEATAVAVPTLDESTKLTESIYKGLKDNDREPTNVNANVAAEPLTPPSSRGRMGLMKLEDTDLFESHVPKLLPVESFGPVAETSKSLAGAIAQGWSFGQSKTEASKEGKTDEEMNKAPKSATSSWTAASWLAGAVAAAAELVEGAVSSKVSKKNEPAVEKKVNNKDNKEKEDEDKDKESDRAEGDASSSKLTHASSESFDENGRRGGTYVTPLPSRVIADKDDIESPVLGRRDSDELRHVPFAEGASRLTTPRAEDKLKRPILESPKRIHEQTPEPKKKPTRIPRDGDADPFHTPKRALTLPPSPSILPEAAALASTSPPPPIYHSPTSSSGDLRRSTSKILPPVLEETQEDGDTNRDSGFSEGAPSPLSRFARQVERKGEQQQHRDSGVHLRDWPENGQDGRPISRDSTWSAAIQSSRSSVEDATQAPGASRKAASYSTLAAGIPVATRPATVTREATGRSVSDNTHVVGGDRRQRTSPQLTETPTVRRTLSNTSLARRRTPEPLTLWRPESPGISPGMQRAAYSSTPPLRRIDRMSGDLRSLSQQGGDDHSAMSGSVAPPPHTASSVGTKEITRGGRGEQSPRESNTGTPVANEGRVRDKGGMTDVYDGYGEGRIGSPRSPTRPHSMRRRQSMQVLELENRVEQLMAENRMLMEARVQAEQIASQRTVGPMVERDGQIEKLKKALELLQQEVERLREVNKGLNSAINTSALQHGERFHELETKHSETARELQDRDAMIASLQAQLAAAQEQIRAMQAKLLATKPPDNELLKLRDVDYFDRRCQQLCAHVQQWVLRFSKFSDMRACRLTGEINDEKIVDRLDNAVLDGSDVDDYLRDRVLRRDVFMAMTMYMVWEFVFTRYLFGMDREQRQKIKALEKTLLEVGPVAAVRQWRAVTLTLLMRQASFREQRDRDTEAVVQAILETLSAILPPPTHMEDQIETQLRRVVREAVELSIEMRCQRAEYMMLPPLQPEYDAAGELVEMVAFNPELMHERSKGGGRDNSESDEENQRYAGLPVRIVLFPLVVKKGDDDGRGDDEIVVCPAQVLVAAPVSSGGRRTASGMGTELTPEKRRLATPISDAGGVSLLQGVSPSMLSARSGGAASRSNASMADVPVAEAQYIEGGF